ncbi:MAG: hypothetical protein IKM58_04955 [Tidjanibacter sp.]|nr:hypothetical protein [Tidjanibacter sp.]
MKKAIKITAWSLAGVVVFAVVAVSVVLGMISSSGRMTDLANKYSQQFLPCQTEIGRVDLVLLKTFPHVSVLLEDVVVVNPEYEAADTILYAGRAYASIDLKRFLKTNSVVSDRILLEKAAINIHTDSTGLSNLDIFMTGEPTESEPMEELPFNLIDLEKVALTEANIRFTDAQAGMAATVDNLNMELKGSADKKTIKAEKLELTSGPISFISDAQKMDVSLSGASFDLKGNMNNPALDALANLAINNLCFSLAEEEYVTNLSAKAVIPVKGELDKNKFTFENASLSVAELALMLNGEVTLEEENILTDLTISGKDWELKELLSLVPAQYASYLDGVEADGILTFSGNAKGVINDTEMPFITLDASFSEGKATYEKLLPFPLNKIEAEISAAIDPTNKQPGSIRIERLDVATPRSNLSANGTVANPLGDMLCNLNAGVSLDFAEVAPFIPDTLDLAVDGKLNGKAQTRFRMSDIEKERFSNIYANATLTTDNISARYDTINLSLAGGDIKLELPARTDNSFAFVAFTADSLNMNAGQATLLTSAANLTAEINEFPDLTKHNNIKSKFNIGSLTFDCDTLNAALSRLGGDIAVAGVLADTTSLPDLKVALTAGALSANACDTLRVKMNEVALMAENITGADKQHPTIKVQFDQQLMDAAMGSQSVLLGRTGIKADLEGDLAQKEILLQWTPTGYVNVKNATVKIDAVPDAIQIPDIDFVFTPEEYTINRSSMAIDDSDFELTGTLRNVNSYLRGDSLLRGELKFLSTVTDVNYFMNMFSGLGSEESDVEYAPEEVVAPKLTDLIAEQEHAPEEVTAPQLTKLMAQEPKEAEEVSAGPFIVPKGISVVLNTQIDNALIGTNVARNVNGAITVDDGVLVLDGLNFTSSAAEVQLTAMYKSPRRDHLYVGVDYHMTNVEIGNLLATFPDLGEMMPMLNSFGGTGEFHMAVETNLDSLYNLKKSTLRGAASIVGNDLVLMDGETFTTIAKKLHFSKGAENKIDSLSAEFTVFRNEIDIYPFLIVMDRYKAIVGGRHNLDMSMNYNVSMLQNAFLPIRLGVDIFGTPEKLKFRLRRSRYDSEYRPIGRKSLEASQINLRNMIHESLSSGVIRTGATLTTEEPQE